MDTQIEKIIQGLKTLFLEEKEYIPHKFDSWPKEQSKTLKNILLSNPDYKKFCTIKYEYAPTFTKIEFHLPAGSICSFTVSSFICVDNIWKSSNVNYIVEFFDKHNIDSSFLINS